MKQSNIKPNSSKIVRTPDSWEPNQKEKVGRTVTRTPDDWKFGGSVGDTTLPINPSRPRKVIQVVPKHPDLGTPDPSRTPPDLSQINPATRPRYIQVVPRHPFEKKPIQIGEYTPPGVVPRGRIKPVNNLISPELDKEYDDREIPNKIDVDADPRYSDSSLVSLHKRRRWFL